MSALESFLYDFTRPSGPKKNEYPHTHTWFPTAKSVPRTLSIPPERYQQFFNVYMHEVNTPLSSTIDILDTPYCVTEKIGTVFPFFLDIDMDIEQVCQNKWDRVKMEHVTQVMLDTVNCTLGRCVENPDTRSIVTERLFYKRHIHWPNVFVDKKMASDIVLVLLDVLKDQFPEITNWDKVVDKSVFNTGLRMIGSHKGSITKHDEVVFHRKAFPSEPFSHVYFPVDNKDKKLTIAEIELLSIHRQGHLVTLREPIIAAKRGTIKSSSTRTSVNELTKQIAAVELQEKHCDIPEEIQQYFEDLIGKVGYTINSFVMIGRCAMRINLEPAPCIFKNATHSRTVNRQQSAVWCHVSSEKVSLRCWSCKETRELSNVSVELCKTLFNMTQDEINVMKCITAPTTENITNFILSVLGDRHACVPRTESSYRWFTFIPDRHRWMEDRFIIDDIMHEEGLIQELIQRATISMANRPSNDEEAGNREEESKKLFSGAYALKNKLQTWSFVSKEVLPVLGYKLHVKNVKKYGKSFIELLDNNQKLIGFTNGVYDLTTMKFRRGHPEDFISKSTTIPYCPLKDIPKVQVTELMDSLTKVFPVKEELDYMLWEIAQCLDGTPTTQRFFMLTGHGSNGKSTIVRLINLALGEYAGEADVSLFTKQRPSSNAPSEDLMALKGKRFVVCNEPNQHDKLYLGTIKWLTGGDRITGRGIYEKQQSFYLQCTIFMLCNHIPQIQASQEDFGTWRRIRPRPLRNRFVEKPEKPNDIKADPEINSKMPQWAPIFAAMLIDILESKTYLEEPAFFAQSRLNLQDRSNHIERFIQDHVSLDKETSVATSCIQVYNAFRVYMKNMGTTAMIQFDEFIRKAEQKLGAPERLGGQLTWNCELNAPTAF